MASEFPTRIHSFLCADTVRQDASGKGMIIGAYSAGVILLPPGTPFPAAIPLGLFIEFKDGEGTFDAKIKISDPSKKSVFPGEFLSYGRVEKKPNQGMQLLAEFPQFILPAIGKYIVQIILDDRVYEDGFSIGYAPVAKPAA